MPISPVSAFLAHGSAKCATTRPDLCRMEVTAWCGGKDAWDSFAGCTA